MEEKELEVVKSKKVKDAIRLLRNKIILNEDSSKEERKAIRVLTDAYIERLNRCEDQNKQITQLRAELNHESKELIEEMVESKVWQETYHYEKEIEYLKDLIEEKNQEIERIKDLYEIQCQTNARMVNEFLDKK